MRSDEIAGRRSLKAGVKQLEETKRPKTREEKSGGRNYHRKKTPKEGRVRKKNSSEQGGRCWGLRRKSFWTRSRGTSREKSRNAVKKKAGRRKSQHLGLDDAGSSENVGRKKIKKPSSRRKTLIRSEVGCSCKEKLGQRIHQQSKRLQERGDPENSLNASSAGRGDD